VTRRLEGIEDARGVSRGRENLGGGSAGVVMSVSKNGCTGVSLGMGAATVRGFFNVSCWVGGAGRFGMYDGGVFCLSSAGLSRVKYRSFHCSGAMFMETCYN
jgi:hypothetical protein